MCEQCIGVGGAVSAGGDRNAHSGPENAERSVPARYNEAKNRSPLAQYSELKTCRDIMRAYSLYKYNKYKEEYETHGDIE